MAETRMMSGHLSKDAHFRLEVEGPYTAENVGRLIELLTLHREWLREPPEREPGTGWTIQLQGAGDISSVSIPGYRVTRLLP